MTQNIKLAYSIVYPFPSNYKWSEFLLEGIYIFLTYKQQRKIGDKVFTLYTPIYVGQAQNIGPELLRHYHSSQNHKLRAFFKEKPPDIYVVYAPVKGEIARKYVEAKLINIYLSRGFELFNQQVPEPPPLFEINVF